MKLSVCIPTYNRQQYLSQTLQVLLDQMKNIQDEVEIVISDNASSDGTQEYIESLMHFHPNITYFKWDTNQGADKNFLKVVDLASGDYCWFMGDDDAPYPKALNEVLQRISDSTLDILLMNRSNCDIHMLNCSADKWLSLNEDRVFNIFSDLKLIEYFNYCISLGGVFSYLSSIVFKRGRWVRYEVPYEFIGSAYSHAYVLLSMVRDGVRLEYCAAPKIMCRGENDSFLLQGNICKRVLLDFRGYQLLGSRVFQEKISVQRSLMKILTREHRIVRMLANLAQVASEEDWRELEQFLVIAYPPVIIRFLTKYKHSFIVKALLKLSNSKLNMKNRKMA